MYQRRNKREAKNILRYRKIQHIKLWDATRDILGGKFITVNAYIKKKI